MTAHAMTGDREKSLQVGMNDHVAKPIDPEALFTTLLKWIKPMSNRDDTRSLGTEASINSKVEDSDGSHIPSPVEGNDDLPPSLAGFDLEAGLKRLQGNRRLYRKLLLDFLSHYSNFADEIHQALASNDIEGVHGLVHNIKGLAGNLSATDLQKTAIEMDSSVKKALSDGELMPGQLDSNFSALKRSLDDALASCQTLARPEDEKSDISNENLVLSLPPDLAGRTAERLHDAADMGNITDLKLIAEELKSDSYAGISERITQLSEKITQLAENFDFDGIIKLAAELESRTKIC